MSFVGKVGIYSYGSKKDENFFFLVLRDNSGHYSNKLFIGTILTDLAMYRNCIVQGVEYNLSNIEWLSS